MGTIEAVGSFEEQVLVGILRKRDEAYGMAVRRLLEEVTGREVAIGAVYATLDRLEAKGLVRSERSDGGGARRLFTVTAAGLSALARTREARDRLWRGVDLARFGLRPQATLDS
jgi:PadR family transcriptional regulator PadR